MCGIVGYVGEKEAQEILLNSLSKLEYRGYDSAGIAVLNGNNIGVEKCKGRLLNLQDKLNEKPLQGTIGIGHTRWATHGEPSDINAHPHVSQNGRISVVHNGIIENYVHLKNWLMSKGYKFYSDTDTEVIPNLIDYFYDDDLLDAVMKATSRLKGSYALGVVSNVEPDKIIAVRKDSPLIVGVGEGEYFIASDVPAILSYTKDVYYLNDNEFVVLTKDGVDITSKYGKKVEKDINHITWDAEAAEKGGFDHFMIKEIHEQPNAFKNTMASRLEINNPINFDNVEFTKEELDNISKVYIVACGTAYHAGVVGKYAIEKLARISVEVDVASEFRYRDPIIDDKTLLIVLSQSGETADTLAAVREVKQHGGKVIAITNVIGSSIARETDKVIYTWAGPEIAVASTKAYTTQLAVMYMLALQLAEVKETLSEEEVGNIKSEILSLPEKIESVLKKEDFLKKFVDKTYMHKDMFFIGRGVDYAAAMEGSLKLKEVSYVHSEAYAGGELKHGPIALIEDGTVVIALATQDSLYEKMVSNIKEVKTRGGNVLAIVKEGNTSIENLVDSVLYIPKTDDILTPVLSVILLQIFAYYMAIKKGCDVDKPRNLAKSVTVE